MFIQNDEMCIKNDASHHQERATTQVSFQWKNPDFPLMNPDFPLKNPDFLFYES